jgi:hypothetical protein
MSRPESQALGGYFKTQDEIRPLIYRRFAGQHEIGDYCIVDPCAGEGEAAIEFVDEVFGKLSGRRQSGYGKEQTTPSVSLVLVELELDRWVKAGNTAWGCVESGDREVLHGDGLCCDATGAGASLLWLNPPYDFFRGQRFETRFLDAWTPRIVGGGQLVLIVPEHALDYLASTLTRWYDDVEVLRYPEPVYSEFKQVVVLGTKRVLERQATALPAPRCLRDSYHDVDFKPRVVPPGALKVDVNALDVAALRAATAPWCGQAGYDRPAQPPQIGLAMRPKPAHVAMALGSGVFNGVRLTAAGRHDLLAKAVFQRQFVDADVKKDEHGGVVKLTQVERPQLRLTILDLETGEYRELLPATEPTINTETLKGEIVNFADLLLVYGDSMVAAMRERCPSLHDGAEDVPLRPMARTLFPAQASAVRAALKLVVRGETPLVLGEIGSGKTSVALQTLWDLADANRIALNVIRGLRITNEHAFPSIAHVPLVRRALVVCPPHLVQNWIDEAKACLPSVPVRVLDRVTDVDAAASMQDGLVLYILSREQAKLGHGVEGVSCERCPKCGAKIAESQDKLGKSRAVCQGQVVEPLDTLAGIAWNMRRSFNWGRRAAIVPLLRRLKAGTSRIKTTWESWRHEMPSEEQGKIVAALKLCAPDPRMVRCLRLIYPKQVAYGQTEPSDQYILREFAHSEAKDAGATLRQALASFGKWRTRSCGEQLYQAVPTPRRYPLANYICRKHPRLFQIVIPDEFHEYSTEGSAQERALHRLTECVPLCLPLTGSLMNGYAKSLFRNLWAVSRKMRAEFAYSDHTKFCKLYGYQKRVLTGDALQKAKVTEIGSFSDRVVKTEGGERLSDAPGVLPSFVLRHVLPLSVTLHKRDIMPDDRIVDHDRAEIVILDAKHSGDGVLLGQKLRDAVKSDRYDEILAGKLFGQLAEYPSYFDRATADTGNAGTVGARTFELRYPADVGGMLVASGGGLPASEWLAKEEWLRSVMHRELDERRNVLLFLWHKDLSDRLIQLVNSLHCGPPAFLDAGKVQAKKRQGWIDKNVVGKRRVMITNPTCVMTGLNNLIWFSTAIFFENPGCNPFIARQAVGRLDRITQTKDVRVYWPVYEGVQCALLDLLQAKTAISQQIDGIDPTAALEMAGAGNGAAVQAQDVGLAVYRYLGGD